MLDNQVIEHLGGIHQTHRADVQFNGVSLDTSRRQFHVFVVHRVLHVHRRKPVARHFDGVKPQAHGILFLTPNRHAAHVGNGLQLFLHRQVGNLAQFKQRAFFTLQCHHQDWRSVGVSLRHRRRVAVTRQVTLGTRHLVAHVVGRRLQIHRQLELHRNAAASLRTHTGQRTDAGNTIDILLQRLGNLVFYHIGIGPGVGTRHGDNGIVHGGVFAHTERNITNHTKQNDDDGHHGGQHRATDT